MKNKFENIKVGDTVFTEQEVRYGWHQSERFFIPEKVEKVTKTQFSTESGKRFRKDGKQVGEFMGWAYFEGDKLNGFRNGIVKDQSEEMKAFKIKLNLEINITKMIEELPKISRNSDFTLEELKDIAGKVKELEMLLTKPAP